MGQRNSREPVLPTSTVNGDTSPTATSLTTKYLRIVAIYLPFLAANIYFLATDGSCMIHNADKNASWFMVYLIGDTATKLVSGYISIMLTAIIHYGPKLDNRELKLIQADLATIEVNPTYNTLFDINIVHNPNRNRIKAILEFVQLILILVYISDVAFMVIGWTAWSFRTFSEHSLCSYALSIYVFIKLILEPFIALTTDHSTFIFSPINLCGISLCDIHKVLYECGKCCYGCFYNIGDCLTMPCTIGRPTGSTPTNNH